MTKKPISHKFLSSADAYSIKRKIKTKVFEHIASMVEFPYNNPKDFIYDVFPKAAITVATAAFDAVYLDNSSGYIYEITNTEIGEEEERYMYIVNISPEVFSALEIAPLKQQCFAPSKTFLTYISDISLIVHQYSVVQTIFGALEALPIKTLLYHIPWITYFAPSGDNRFSFIKPMPSYKDIDPLLLNTIREAGVRAATLMIPMPIPPKDTKPLGITISNGPTYKDETCIIDL